jgi:hypothetical protein
MMSIVMGARSGDAMSARNIYHDAVVRALTVDGWTITDDPFPLSFGGKNLSIDLGAERATLAAEKEGRTIAAEIQSFLGRSPVRSLEEAVGQYGIYRLLLANEDPDRVLYMAVSRKVYKETLADKFGQFVVAGLNVRLIVFDEKKERIIKWIE